MGRETMEAVDRYSIHVFADELDGGYVAVCPEFPGISAFGDSREEALEEARVALELAIETYRDEGWPLPEPRGIETQDLPSGEFRVRLPRTMHAQLAKRAATEGVSQNQLVVAYIAAGLAGQSWHMAADVRTSRVAPGGLLSLEAHFSVGAAAVTTHARHRRDDFTDAADWQLAGTVIGPDAGDETRHSWRDVN